MKQKIALIYWEQILYLAKHLDLVVHWVNLLVAELTKQRQNILISLELWTESVIISYCEGTLTLNQLFKAIYLKKILSTEWMKKKYEKQDI